MAWLCYNKMMMTIPPISAVRDRFTGTCLAVASLSTLYNNALLLTPHLQFKTEEAFWMKGETFLYRTSLVASIQPVWIDKEEPDWLTNYSGERAGWPSGKYVNLIERPVYFRTSPGCGPLLKKKNVFSSWISYEIPISSQKYNVMYMFHCVVEIPHEHKWA